MNKPLIALFVIGTIVTSLIIFGLGSEVGNKNQNTQVTTSAQDKNDERFQKMSNQKLEFWTGPPLVINVFKDAISGNCYMLVKQGDPVPLVQVPCE